jgi:hypothetical protein
MAATISYPRIRRARTLYEEQSAEIRALINPTIRQHVQIDPLLGWLHTPGFQDSQNRMNSAGLRGVREYTPTPAAGVLRVAAFGDSFVYGAEVDGASSWAGLLERQHPDIEVLNYGVSGYGVDQAYLRYVRDGKTFSPHVVLMGFVPDDINRNVSVYRRFLSPGAALFKPRYSVAGDGRLTLLDVPVKTAADYAELVAHPDAITRFGRNDYWYPACVYENPIHDYSATLRMACAAGGLVYRRYLDPDRPIAGRIFNQRSTAFKIQVALFHAFFAAARERGAVPLIVTLPDQKAVNRARHGEPAVYQPLLDYMRAHDVSYLDAADAFSESGGENETTALFAPGGHYSSRGNQLVASWLASRLRHAAPNQSSFEVAGDRPPSRTSTADRR